MSDDPAAAVMAVKSETFLSHWQDIRDAKHDLGSVATEVARTKKAAKRDGVDLDVVKLVEKLSDMETDERHVFLAKVETYCKWLELPLGAFSAGIAVQEPKEATRQDFRKWQAGEDGYMAGLNGAPKEANPHRPKTPEATQWDKRWDSGFRLNQKKEAGKMAKAARAGRKPPGNGGAVTGKMAAAGEGLTSSIN